MALRGTQNINTKAAPFGVVGGYSAEKGYDRVDLNSDDFSAQIEMHGQRLAWSRALRCPCQPVNDQTDQPDPECTLCGGTAWAYFGPQTAQPLPEEGFTEVQRLAASYYGAFVLRGLVTGFAKDDQPWAQYGSWRNGSASLTVRHGNQLGFMDRIVHLDAEIIFSEVVAAPARAGQALKTRYFVSGQVYMVRTHAKVLQPQRDYHLRGGRIYPTEAAGLASDARVAVHYATFPTFMVVDIPSANRMSNQLMGGDPVPSNQGAPTQMPQRATLRLEFLPEPRDTAGAQRDG